MVFATNGNNNIGAGVARLNSATDVGAGNGNNDTAVGLADNGSHVNVTASFGSNNTSVGVAGDHGFRRLPRWPGQRQRRGGPCRQRHGDRRRRPRQREHSFERGTSLGSATVTAAEGDDNTAVGVAASKGSATAARAPATATTLSATAMTGGLSHASAGAGDNNTALAAGASGTTTALGEAFAGGGNNDVAAAVGSTDGIARAHANNGSNNLAGAIATHRRRRQTPHTHGDNNIVGAAAADAGHADADASNGGIAWSREPGNSTATSSADNSGAFAGAALLEHRGCADADPHLLRSGRCRGPSQRRSLLPRYRREHQQRVTSRDGSELPMTEGGRPGGAIQTGQGVHQHAHQSVPRVPPCVLPLPLRIPRSWWGTRRLTHG